MGIRGYNSIEYLVKQSFLNSMSQDYLQAGIFSFSNGSFERSQQEQHHQQQIPREKLRIQGFEDEESGGVLPVYETAGMLQEMFNFPSTELLENQISQAYRIPRTVPPTGASSAAADWFLHRQGIVGGVGLGDPKNQPHQISNINADSSVPMQLFGHNEIQGLSLSLSSSLQQFEAAKAEELRMEDGGIMFFGQGLGGGSSFGAVNIIRNSKYSKAAQELLEEFCNVGGNGQFFRKNRFKTNPSSNTGGGGGATGGEGGGAGGGNSSSSSKDITPLAAVDRVEHQRRKVKLLSMLDEVDRRYNHYCEQMQMVVNSFDMVMGFGAAVPYTCLAQKAMSRHFRCLKDAVSDKIKQTCDLLGEKDAGGTSGITKGETPRLKILEQSLRQQRAFNHIGIMEQEAWRPQRGLPERSVNILRAWLFEHFLNPYPSDADKHLLARQTGLSRNQVSNWFINARVRLWKPMVEEMYQQESKDEPQEIQRDQNSSSINNAQTPTPPAAAITHPPGKRLEINATENDPSFMAINNKQCFSENQAKISTNANVSMPVSDSAAFSFPAVHESGIPRRNHADVEPTLIRFGTSSGDVSLTLGLRHAGDSSEKSPFFC